LEQNTYYDIVVQFVIAGVVIIVSYLVVSKILSVLRSRRIIGSRTESTIKLVSIVALLVIVLPIPIASVSGIPEAKLVALGLIVALAVAIIAATWSFLANGLSYMFFQLWGIVKENEYVIIDLGGRRYEGLAHVEESSYLILRGLDGSTTLIPYGVLPRAVITKLPYTFIKAYVDIALDPDANLEELLKSVDRAVKSVRILDQYRTSISLINVSNSSARICVRAALHNPKNLDEAKTQIVKALSEVKKVLSVEFEKQP